MLRIIVAVTLALWGSLAMAQDNARAPAIQGVIDGQIAAFRADDFEAAFSYASPNIQRIFGSSQQFAQMVQQGYPMVYRPDDVRFLELSEVGGRTRQTVLMRDANGVFHTLAYDMIPTDDGWQIDGVQLLQAADVVS